ncbi:MAG: KGK domain-containing protein [Coleofasciculus chthonoplastes F3-SA18-01]|uniref:KGK domain-containing protein n=1 Tax=Coleofasciculus chthonoplastes TaxID=64178 RepID=UPI0032FE6AA0
MGVDNQFEPLASGEVLSVDESAQILIGHHTFRVGELADAIKTQLEHGLSEWTQDKNAWFSEEGISCEVLRFSAGGWQKGKVRINLEFCPQEVAEEKMPVESVSAEDENEDEDEFSVPDDSLTMDEELDLEQPSMSLDEADHDYELSAFNDEDQQQDSLGDIYDEMDEGTSFQMEELEEEEPPVSFESDFDELSTDEEEEPSVSFESDFEEMSPLEEEEPVSFGDDLEELSTDEDISASFGDEFDELSTDEDTSASFGDEFDELSQSIEEELEMEEESTNNDDELLDLGEIATESDEELDFDATSASDEDEDEFDLGDFSSNLEEEEDNDTDSLLDDVWEEMSSEGWQSNQ